MCSVGRGRGQGLRRAPPFPPTSMEPAMKLHRRTLSLMATPAVVGALTVAVPALAGTSAQPAGHAARVRSCNVVTVISHGRREHACLLRGPRGLPGVTGLRGPAGAKGSRGPKGATG